MKAAKILLAAVLLLLAAHSTAFAYDNLKMLNSTGNTIFFVYLAPSSSKSWGSDRLSGVWQNGNTLTLNVPKHRYWDLKIVFKGGAKAEFTKGIDTTQVYMLTITRNNEGGYTLHYNS